MPVRRTREISIRKILGASGRGLALHRWLASYAYHTSLTADMFGLPLLLLGIITLSVTGLRVIRTGLRSPVESLRAE